MATTFKTLGAKDVVATRSLLHESIPITGSIISGTYETAGGDTDENIKNYSHGMFQSVYDYPYLSSSANHIFDLTAGYAASSPLSNSANSQNSKKINLYNQMAQVLMGYDHTASVLLFDNGASTNSKMKECVFVNFARLLTKDEIKKGTFELILGMSSSFSNPMPTDRVKLADAGAATDFKVDSPAGEYGVLYATNDVGDELVNNDGGAKSVRAGLIFYQAGIAVVTGAVFMEGDGTGTGGLLSGSGPPTERVHYNIHEETFDAVLTGSVLSSSCDSFRNRIYNLSFNNTTELNSTIYFCRAASNDFNYSSNPTYLSASKIRVKENVKDEPIAYITTVGLYSPDNALLAVAKVSEPLKKQPTDEITLRVRLDY